MRVSESTGRRVFESCRPRAEPWQEVSINRTFLSGPLIRCLAPLGFASGLPQHVKLEVRPDQVLSSEISHSGDRFSATLDRDVSLSDKTLLKKGASVQGVVREAESNLNPGAG